MGCKGRERQARKLPPPPKGYAANQGGGEVRIHRPTGPIRDSDTVKPARDPNPPRDKRH